jgi:hypothetical protein
VTYRVRIGEDLYEFPQCTTREEAQSVLDEAKAAYLRELGVTPWTCASCGRTLVGSPGDPGTSRDAVRCPVRSGSEQCVPCSPDL